MIIAISVKVLTTLSEMTATKSLEMAAHGTVESRLAIVALLLLCCFLTYALRSVETESVTIGALLCVMMATSTQGMAEVHHAQWSLATPAPLHHL